MTRRSRTLNHNKDDVGCNITLNVLNKKSTNSIEWKYDAAVNLLEDII